MFTPVSIRRRCAAQGCADALIARRKVARRPATVGDCSRNAHASGCWHVVCAESTAAARLAGMRPQPRQQQQEEAIVSLVRQARPAARVRERRSSARCAPMFRGHFWGWWGTGGVFPPAKICLKSGVSGQIFLAGLRPAPRWGSRPRPPLHRAPPSPPDMPSLPRGVGASDERVRVGACARGGSGSEHTARAFLSKFLSKFSRNLRVGA